MSASYPASLKSYTTKVDNVDDVLAADMNSVQEEIVAIETALGVGLTNTVVQVVNTQSGALTTGTTVMPFDDTIPQNTEGDEYMTRAITPKSATNKLKITVVVHGGHSATSAHKICAALFQDTTAGALAAGYNTLADSGSCGQITFVHYMTAGTTSATTFKVRAGGADAGTFSFNGQAGGRIFGGVCASSITIEEIKV